MIANAISVQFTEDDIENLRVYAYSKQEVGERTSEYRKKVSGRITCIAVVLIVATVTNILLTESFFGFITMVVAMASFGALLFYSFFVVYQYYATVRNGYYIECMVEAVKPIEIRRSGPPRNRKDYRIFSLVGYDTTTHFSTTYCVSAEEYAGAKEGERLRISVKEAQLSQYSKVAI